MHRCTAAARPRRHRRWHKGEASEAQRPPTGVWGGKRRRRAASPLMCSAGVGSGTTAPLNNFELYNNGGVGGTTQANITSWAGGATTTNTAALNLRVQGAGSGSVDNIISAQYNASGAGNYSIALKPGGATTAMTVVGNGNVGIGTAVPSAPLHVYNSGGVSLATTGTVNYTNTSILGFGYGGGSSGTRDSFRIISQVVNRDNGAGPYYDYGVQADLAFQRKTNNLYASAANDITYTDAMRISGVNGFVGIGTSPLTPLHAFSSSTGHPSIIRINTTISSFGLSANGGRLEWYGTYTGNGGAYFQAAIQAIDDVSGDSGYGGLAFITVNNTTQRESMRISSGGFVGIGTAAPAIKFQVVNTGYGGDAGYVSAGINLYTTYSSYQPVVSFRLGWYSDTWDIGGQRGPSVNFAAINY